MVRGLAWGWQGTRGSGHPPSYRPTSWGDVDLLRPCKGKGSPVVPQDHARLIRVARVGHVGISRQLTVLQAGVLENSSRLMNSST